MLIKSKIISAEETPLQAKMKQSKVFKFYFINVLEHRITWRDMLCITPLKAGLPVAVRRLFSFCRGGKWNCYSYKFKFFVHFLLEVFPRNRLRSSMDYGLTQSQVDIVGLKIVNSLNRINRCVKFITRNRLLVTFVVFFTALWTFWHFIV